MKKLFNKIGDFFTKIFYPKKIEATKHKKNTSKTKNALSEQTNNESSISKELKKLRENARPSRNVKEKSKEITGLKSVKNVLTKKTKEQLTEEMLIAVKAEKYELAAKLRDKIKSINS